MAALDAQEKLDKITKKLEIELKKVPKNKKAAKEVEANEEEGFIRNDGSADENEDLGD